MEIEVCLKPQFMDAGAAGAMHELNLAGEAEISAARTARIYSFSGDIPRARLGEIAGKLLCDPVTESWGFSPYLLPEKGWKRVEVRFKNSVTDPAGESVEEALAGKLPPGCRVRCADVYLFKTAAGAQKLERAVLDTLANELVCAVKVI
ncbi:MAG: hypothetical protein WC421_01915 [Elusimicrobiales bacterium]